MAKRIWPGGLLLVVLYQALAMPASGEDEPSEAHWAFQLLQRPSLPSVEEGRRVRAPLDRFILSRLASKGLSFSSDAERVTLVRRAWLDLAGVPPTPADVAAFQGDASPDAYDRVVDRLLSGPAFGERWARHWLDVVGYMDTTGFDQDANLILVPEGKWRYRHYVIDAFNKDKPYDRFVHEQLAGDELYDWRSADRYTDEMREALIATGFLRTAADFTHEPESFIELNMFEVLHDTIEIVNTSLLGITMHCSRCHDHKFDPLTQQEYYRLMSCFTPAYNPENWKAVYPWKPDIVQRGMPDVAPAEKEQIDRDNQALKTRVAALKQQIAAIHERARQTVLDRKMAAYRSGFPAIRKASPKAPVEAGLSLWLRADQGVFADPASTEPAAIGSTVGSWQDQQLGDNVEANDVTQRLRAQRPTLVEGFGVTNARALRFDGNATHLRAPDHPTLRPEAGLTLFVSYKLNRVPDGDRTMVAKYAEDGRSHGNWGADLYHESGQPANRARIYFGDPQKPGDYGGGRAGSRSLSDLLPHQLTYVYDQGQTTIRVDQQAEETRVAGREPPRPAIDAMEPVDLLVGARITGPETGGTVFPGDIAEVLLYRQTLAADEIAQVEKYLEGKYGRSTEAMKVSESERKAAISPSQRTALVDLQKEITEVEGQRKTVGRLQALYDVGPPPATRLLEGGSYLSPGDTVQPGVIHALSRSDRDYFQESADKASSGRRTALARWMTDAEEPAGALLSRVMTNRIWQHLFGEGIVPTSENLGLNGSEPTHPLLLEWLSDEFVRSDWGVKQMLRRLVTSTTYRQASLGTVPPGHPDPTNQLLGRMRLRRLDAEVIRDSILAVTDQLDRTMGGPPVYVKAGTDGSVTIDASKLSSPSAGQRRSVYLLHRRNYNLSMLSTFDQPLIATTCARRNPAAVVSQSLMMLNDRFLFEQSQKLADRVMEMSGELPEQRIKAVFRLVLARLPNDTELEFCTSFVQAQKRKYPQDADQQALVQLCHTLLNTSEFLYAE